MFSFSIDRGGTFTDVVAELPDGSARVLKLLSVDPENYRDGPTEGIRRVIADYKDQTDLGRDSVPDDEIRWIRMGTTVATNALLERNGARVLFVTTKGFGDCLRIGDQTRDNIFDLRMLKSQVLYEATVEVDERVTFQNNSFKVERAPDLQEVWKKLQSAFDAGIRSVAICLLHAYGFTEHEEQIASVCTEMGFTNVSVSSRLVPMVRMERRASTTCADAYLSPLIDEYVANFKSGFQHGLEKTHVSFIMSDGGLCKTFSGYKALLSGPAGGVVGYSRGTPNEDGRPLLGFDMGGTSTDVSRFDGTLSHFYSAVIAGVKIQAPQLDITTVAAGGGSRLFFRSGLLVVGPESARAHPGPVCYRKGGHLAVTDANVVLGRIVPELFPKIFGPEQNQALDYQASYDAMQELCNEVNSYNDGKNSSGAMSVEELALGFVAVANEAMARPIRNLSEGRGFSASSHALACFGGAGGQHACALAKSLGMDTVYIHRYAGVLSAYGIGLADAVEDVQAPVGLPLHDAQTRDRVLNCAKELQKTATEKLEAQGLFVAANCHATIFLNLRFKGTDTALMISGSLSPDDAWINEFKSSFEQQYEREFGFLLENRDLIVDDVRVRVAVHSDALAPPRAPTSVDENPSPVYTSKAFFSQQEGRVDTPVFQLSQLPALFSVQGPAIIVDETNTVLVEPQCLANILPDGCIKICVAKAAVALTETHLVDSILLSVFAHRFMSIAEQMGRTLQRTSVSTNIKERKDFSCAIFGPAGGLVANAPHLPVHLGSMQDAIRWQIAHLGDSWKEGYVVVSNHPQAGGTHLPDITCITPVFHNGSPVFYVASRGHHADIGGISPGSMPPFSKWLEEEGAAIESHFLVKNGQFDTRGITDILNAPGLIPLKYSNQTSSSTRDLKNNINDLQAQVAANQKGIVLMHSLIKEYGLQVVVNYMQHVQANCELAVRDLLRQVARERGATFSSSDFMDDGSKINLAVTIDGESGDAVFDFAGTSDQVHGNSNAPRAITYSAVIYSLRCLVDRDIPLNQGVMAPVNLILNF